MHTLLVTGDVGLVRMVNYTNVQANDFTRPFLHTAELLRSADLTWVNPEGPLVPGCAPTHVGLVFCVDPRKADGLRFAGVDVASLANNTHSRSGSARARKLAPGP
ncbi:MAG: CapA family protein [Actinobacteria bacterium]|nr:CapA family protein [Actinomycetota bacterium]